MESVISLLVLFGTCFSSTDILKTHTCKIKELSDEKTDPKKPAISAPGDISVLGA